MNTKAATILALAAAAGVGAAYFAARPGPASDAAQGADLPALPELAARAGDIAQIVVKRAPMEFSIRKESDAWKVADKAGYPANVETVRAALVGLSQLKLQEPKTSRADQYAKLGVEDPAAPPPDSADKAVPQSALVILKDAAGKDIAALILGNPRYGGQGVVGGNTPQLFIRKPGDKQSWLAAGQVDLPREPIGWLDTRFADIKRDRIKSVVVTHPGGAIVAVARDNQSAPFAVKDIPAGRELKDPGVGESIASTLTGLTFQDVGAPGIADAAPGSDVKPGPAIVLRTFDGLIVSVASVSKDARAWWRLTAGADDALVSQLPTAAAAAAAAKTPDGSPVPPPTTPGPPAAGTSDAIRKEIADLNAQWSPFAFAPADWKIRSVNQTLADLIKEPTAPPPAPAPPSAPPSVHGKP
jgi:hypothetical protein